MGSKGGRASVRADATYDARAAERKAGPGLGASVAEFISISFAVFPAALGLGLAQAVLGVTVYSGAAYAEHMFAPNLGTIAAAVPLLVFIAVLGVRRLPLSNKAVFMLALAGVCVQAFSSAGMAAADPLGVNTFAVALVLVVLAVVGNMLAVAYWLRVFKGRHTSLTVVATFVATAICEAITCAMAFLPHTVVCAIAAVAALMQIPLMRVPPNRMDAARPVERQAAAPEYLKVAGRMADDPGFLLSNLAAAMVVSVAASLLWGFPYGTPHVLSPLQRVIGAVFSIVVLLEVARRVAGRRQGLNPVTTWMAMQALGLGSLVLYSLAPDSPAYGMALLLAFNDVAQAYIWCIVVSFMGHGRFDAYCYGIGGMAAFLVPGSFARAGALALSLDNPVFAGFHFPGDMLAAAVLGALVILPAQIVLLNISKAQRSEDVRMGNVVAGLTKALGLGDASRKPTDMRRAFLDEAVAHMKDTFMLSAREADVLSLYALGFTQDKIAKELHISASTAHTHISHIYAKTDMHSRQEIIDYLDSCATPSGLNR